MSFIENYFFLIVGVILVGVWVSIAFIVYKHLKDTPERKSVAFFDVIFLWPIVLKDFKQNKSNASTSRIIIMLILLLCFWQVIAYLGKNYG